MESNHRPHAYQACALTIWAMSPYCRVCQLHSFVWAYLVLLMYSAISCTFDIDYYFSISQSTLKNKQWIHLDLFLLRKEVIQPHLPIRLPCYDFTPIIGSTFGKSLWLRVFPTLMVWRAVCTRPGNVFTTVCWPVITSNSSFMEAGCSLQSELGTFF